MIKNMFSRVRLFGTVTAPTNRCRLRLIMKEEIEMVQILAGEKGQGKTKKIIEMANTSMKESNGHVVYIDDDKRHIYDLHYDVRFVETSGFPLSNYRELVGFICGILSQDSDIETLFVDGLTNIVKHVDVESIAKLVTKLNTLSTLHNVNFIMSINIKVEDLPEEAKKLLIA